jgi:hypothetical protein
MSICCLLNHNCIILAGTGRFKDGILLHLKKLKHEIKIICFYLK